MGGDEASLRIGEVAAQTGLAVSTVRAWEQRYGLLRPSRTSGGHRLYGPGDVARVRAVQSLVRSGLTVAAAAARVGADELVVEPAPVPAPVPVPVGAGAGGGDSRSASGRPTASPVDLDALATVHTATRRLLRATTAAEVVAVLVDATKALGGTVVSPSDTHAPAVPLDLSFGECEPLLPAAEPTSIARLRLEQRLPALVEDARFVIARIRRSDRE